MSETAIRIEGIGKQYRLGEREPYKSLRDSMTRAIRGLVSGRRPKETSRGNFWAVKDVSFEVPRGQILGLIGRNGAGKSTLLKILSRITAPTEGCVTITGRVGSLLEVGVGFHPELTGRENIYLNGAILGMRRAEIRASFDEIVEFAEISQFLDTPVKRYSSGMYVRLAFSVAAHLQPEVLLIDEVLAVGDAAFQKKCMGKMGSVARQGRTILFVSHNMVAISALCERAVLIEAGRVAADGRAGEVVDQYLRNTNKLAEISLADRSDRQGNQALRFLSFELQDAQQKTISHATCGQPVTLAFRYRSANGQPLKAVKVAISVHGRHDEPLFQLWSPVTGAEFESLPPSGEIRCHVPRLPLQVGEYSFNLFSRVGEDIADWVQNAAMLNVESGDFYKTGRLPSVDQGPFLVDHRWSAADA